MGTHVHLIYMLLVLLLNEVFGDVTCPGPGGPLGPQTCIDGFHCCHNNEDCCMDDDDDDSFTHTTVFIIVGVVFGVGLIGLCIRCLVKERNRNQVYYERTVVKTVHDPPPQPYGSLYNNQTSGSSSQYSVRFDAPGNHEPRVERTVHDPPPQPYGNVYNYQTSGSSGNSSVRFSTPGNHERRVERTVHDPPPVYDPPSYGNLYGNQTTDSSSHYFDTPGKQS